MKSKPAVGIVVLLVVVFFTWSVATALGTTILGRDDFRAWRSDNVALYYGIWAAAVVVIGLPALWVVGKRTGEFAEQQDKAALAARGVGNLAARALRGDRKAIDHLVKLLDDGSPAVRYQSARALAILDDKAADEELLRKVRYWDGDHKLGLIDVLKRTMDVRTIKLLRELAHDRNPMVARKARTALTIVSSRSGSIDGLIAKRHKEAQAKEAKAARKRAKAAGAAATPSPEPPSAKAAEPAAEAPADAPAEAATAAEPVAETPRD